MTALQMDAVSVKKAAATLRAVSASQPAERHVEVPGPVAPGQPKRPSVVRPDRPNSRPAPANLAVVPTHKDADSRIRVTSPLRSVAGPQWKIDHPGATVRRPVRRVERNERASSAASIDAYSLAVSVGKIVLGALVGLALFVLGMMIATALGLGMDASHLVYVQPGDTLWSIASMVDAQVPTTQVVSDIQALNGLANDNLIVGQELAIPAY